MLDVEKVKEEAEREVVEEQQKAAKEKIKSLLRKRAQAQHVLSNVDRELNDAYAELGQGVASQPSS